MFSWPTNLALYWWFARCWWRHVFLCKLHSRLLSQSFLSLGHNAVLGRPARSTLLGWKQWQSSKHLGRHIFRLDVAELFFGILLNGLHDFLVLLALGVFRLPCIGHFFIQIRQLTFATLLCCLHWHFLRAGAPLFYVVGALKIKTHLLATL